jgi:hypothetical protein
MKSAHHFEGPYSEKNSIYGLTISIAFGFGGT